MTAMTDLVLCLTRQFRRALAWSIERLKQRIVAKTTDPSRLSEDPPLDDALGFGQTLWPATGRPRHGQAAHETSRALTCRHTLKFREQQVIVLRVTGSWSRITSGIDPG